MANYYGRVPPNGPNDGDTWTRSDDQRQHVFGGGKWNIATGAVHADPGSAPTGALALTPTTGIGNGANGNIQAPAKGTGTGPATPGTVAGFMKVWQGTTAVWVPYFT